MFRIFKVSGESMKPNFKNDHFVLTRKTKNIKENDVVVINLDHYGNILKRVSSIGQNGVKLKSDNLIYESTATFGLHEVSKIVGKVIFKI
jgi:phage repressor protein C with HTH and peptisase S24 domain